MGSSAIGCPTRSSGGSTQLLMWAIRRSSTRNGSGTSPSWSCATRCGSRSTRRWRNSKKARTGAAPIAGRRSARSGCARSRSPGGASRARRRRRCSRRSRWRRSKNYNRMRSLLLAIAGAWVAASWAWALTSDEESNVAIYRRLNAGVVNITNRALAYDFFFNPIPTDSSGSGFILDSRGHILTNHHVVQGAQRLEVSLADGSKWTAKLVGADPQTDLAVLQIKAPPEALTVLPLGDSSALQVGQKVLAIGNPFGLEHSLSAGIISSLRKVVKTGATEIEDVIQTDAAINPGNSGGPLLDSEGRVIGINTAIFTPSGGNIGIGFAIPINTAKRVMADILARGYVVYAYLGAETQTLTPVVARALELPIERGALVVRVVRGSPAARAGLQGGTRQVVIGNAIVIIGGDVVTAADGQAIRDSEDLRRLIRKHQPGDRMQLEVLRPIRQGEFKRSEVEIKLGELPR